VTWPVLESRLVDVLHEALRGLVAGGLPGGVDSQECVVCLLALDDPDFTVWSARQLNSAALVDREFGRS
jgi:hypothetical protein